MWWWVLVWTVLVLGALGVLALLAWRLFRQLLGLGREVGEAAERLAVVGEELDRLTEQADRLEESRDRAPAVFGDATALRAQRAQAARSARRASRRSH